jgi:hypothetical protein
MLSHHPMNDLGAWRGGQTGDSQVAATVTASIPTADDVSAVQPHCGNTFRYADMFPRTLSCLRKDANPLRGPKVGLHAATGVLLVPYLGQARHAAVDRTAAYAAALVAVLAAALLAGRYLRQIMVRRQLARRVSYDLLPSMSFDPSAEDVARFAYQLARTRPSVAWLRPRRSASIRIRLFTDAEGRLCYQINGPSSAGSVLRHQSYPQVELREASPRGDGEDGEASCPTGTNDPGDDRRKDI